MIRRFFCTFGQISPYKDKYVEIEVQDDAITDFEGFAREVMNEAHGQKWSMCYSEQEWYPIRDRYNYTGLTAIRKNEQGYYRAV